MLMPHPDLNHDFRSQPDNLTQFAQYWNLSARQMEQFRLYGEILLDTQQKLNLISKSTESDMWSRHFHDSAQLWPILQECDAATASGTESNPNQPWLVDLGSGGGFPGLVLAILSGKPVRLIEANRHKADFLRRVIAATGLDQVSLVQGKISSQNSQNGQNDSMPKFITARALASLAQLLGWASDLQPEKPQKTKAILIFPKGKTWEDEIKLAKNDWRFHYKSVKSLTDVQSKIIIIKEYARVHR